MIFIIKNSDCFVIYKKKMIKTNIKHSGNINKQLL